MTFVFFGFRNIKYKKPDPVYRPGPDWKWKKNPEPRVPVRFLKPWAPDRAPALAPEPVAPFLAPHSGLGCFSL